MRTVLLSIYTLLKALDSFRWLVNIVVYYGSLLDGFFPTEIFDKKINFFSLTLGLIYSLLFDRQRWPLVCKEKHPGTRHNPYQGSPHRTKDYFDGKNPPDCVDRLERAHSFTRTRTSPARRDHHVSVISAENERNRAKRAFGGASQKSNTADADHLQADWQRRIPCSHLNSSQPSQRRIEPSLQEMLPAVVIPRVLMASATGFLPARLPLDLLRPHRSTPTVCGPSSMASTRARTPETSGRCLLLSEEASAASFSWWATSDSSSSEEEEARIPSRVRRERKQMRRLRRKLRRMEVSARQTQATAATRSSGKTIGISGETSTGKSMVVNSLLGRHVAQTDVGETTRERTAYQGTN